MLNQLPELLELITPIPMEWLTMLSTQDINEGDTRGMALGEASVLLRQLNRHCGALNPSTTSTIQALPLKQLDKPCRIAPARKTWPPGGL